MTVVGVRSSLYRSEDRPGVMRDNLMGTSTVGVGKGLKKMTRWGWRALLLAASGASQAEIEKTCIRRPKDSKKGTGQPQGWSASKLAQDLTKNWRPPKITDGFQLKTWQAKNKSKNAGGGRQTIRRTTGQTSKKGKDGRCGGKPTNTIGGNRTSTTCCTRSGRVAPKYECASFIPVKRTKICRETSATSEVWGISSKVVLQQQNKLKAIRLTLSGKDVS